MKNNEFPSVTYRGLLDMQVCVPTDWTDEEIKEYADKTNMSGTTNGWNIRNDGDKSLEENKEREKCSNLTNYVHIMLDA